MTEDHEHDEGDEAAQAPVSTETVLDEEAAEEEAHEQEPAADESTEAPDQLEAQQAEIEKRMDKAEARFGTYTAKIAEYWGDDAIHLLPFNLDPGAPPGFVDKRNAGRVEDETKAAALEFLGFPREQDYAADPYTQTCQTCKGKTKTKTGSADPQYATRTCPTCKAFGYTIDGRAPNDQAPPANGTGTPNTLTFEPLASGDVDGWNQPRILPTGVPNPNFGKTPEYWIKVEPWGDTRGLTAQSVGA